MSHCRSLCAEERQSPVGMRKPRHTRLSTSIDTVLGDVFAETTSASETIAAEPHQGDMTFARGSQAEAATAAALAQSAARSGLLATWHALVAPDTCLLVSLKVHSMHTQTRATDICLPVGRIPVLLCSSFP